MSAPVRASAIDARRSTGAAGGRVHGVARALLATVVLAFVAFSAPSALAASGGQVSWGTATATASFGKSIAFVQPLRLAATPKRAEILITYPRSDGPFVVDHTPDAAGSPAELRHEIDTGASSLQPNTVLSAQWRLTWADGTTSVGPSVSVTYADDRFRWQTEAGQLVRIHWYEGDAAFGKRALTIAEDGIAKAESLLGVTESDPVDFFVYADQQAFYDALGPGTRENVGGEAVADIRTLFALITPDEVNASWVGTVIPHELTHLVFDTATHNPYHQPPRWLNEGLAVYLSQGYVSSDRGLVSDAVASRTLLPLTALTAQFPSDRDGFFLAYAESVSAVDALVRDYGRDKLVALVRSYARGITDDEAFEASLGLDVGAFEQHWLTGIGGSAPAHVGPQPAPPGPVPSAWTVAGAGTASATSGVATPASSVGGQPSAAAASQAPDSGSSRGLEGLLPVAALVVVAAGVLVLVATRRAGRPR